MKLTVKTLAQKAIPLQVEPSTSVLDIKQLLSEKEGFDVSAQKLIYSGKILVDDQTIESLNVKETDFMVVMVQKPKVTPATATSSNTIPVTPSTSTTTSTPSAPRVDNAPPVSIVSDTPSPNTTAPATTVPASTDPAFVTGSAFETAVTNMVDMGYPRDQVVAAMRAAFNNPDRAFDYLLNGLPTNLQQSATQSPPQLSDPTNTTSQTPASTLPADPNNLFSLAQQQVQQQNTNSNNMGDMGSIVPPEQLTQLRAMVQANPAMIQPILQQVMQANPQLGAAIQANPQLFLQMLLGGGGSLGSDDDDNGEVMLDVDGNPVPPGSTVINITEEEKAAIDRLVSLGFDRNQATEAFLLCDKNEELAANYLFDNQFD